MKTGKYYTPNTGSVVGADGKEEVPGNNSPTPADGQEKPAEKAPPDTLPDDGGDGTIENRSRDYKRDDKGRFAYDGGRKKKRKTKYAPSPKANKSKIKVSPKKFGILRGIFNTQYPNLKAGDTRTINDGKYIYTATADGFGSMSINSKFAIQTKKRSSSHE